MNVDDAIIGCFKSPFVAAFGKNLSTLADPIVVVECNTVRMPSVDMAIVCCFFSFYIFNIKYPTSLRALYLFFECIFKLKPSSPLPTSVQVLLDSINKL